MPGLQYLHTQWILKRKGLARWLPLPQHVPPTRFVILGAPRTGTTLLHTYLNSHPQIYSYGEVMRKQAQAGEDIRLGTLFQPQPKRILATGGKLFYSYGESFIFQPAMDALIADPSIVVFHCVRSETLRSLVSLMLAERSGVWNNRKPGQPIAEADRLTIPPTDYMKYHAQLSQQWQSLQAALTHHTIHEVAYEDLAIQPEPVLNQVQAALYVPQRNLFTLLQRQTPQPLSELVVNWEELLETQLMIQNLQG